MELSPCHIGVCVSTKTHQWQRAPQSLKLHLHQPSYPLSQKGVQQQMWAKCVQGPLQVKLTWYWASELKIWYSKNTDDFCKLFIVDSFLQVTCFGAQDFKKPSSLCDRDISLVIEYIGYRIVDTPNYLIFMQVIFIIWGYICKREFVPLQGPR